MPSLLPFVLCAGDGASSQQSGSEAGGFESDYKRGRRLRKLARMLGCRQAQKVCVLCLAV
jgi:hypothetical protein